MIKKIITNLFFFFFLVSAIFITILSTIGIETNKFNELISNRLAQTKEVKLELKTINFKLDLKELSLFIETLEPTINYKNISIPAKSLKVYIDFLSLFRANPQIDKINLMLNQLSYSELNNLSFLIKPSNFKNFLDNKIKDLKVTSEVDLFLDNKGLITNYIIKGKVQNLEINLIKNLKLSKTNFGFFADKEDILIKNIFGNFENIKISNGDIRLNLENGVNLESNFNSDIDLNFKNIKKYDDLLSLNNLGKSIKLLKGNFNNIISLNFDNTYKLINYNYKVSGKIKKNNFELIEVINNSFFLEEIKEIFFSDLNVDLNLSPKNFQLKALGEYSLNNKDFLKLQIDSDFRKEILKLNSNFEYKNTLDLKFINYKKSNDSIANIFLELQKVKDIININELNFNENNNYIRIIGLKLKNNNFKNLKKLEVKTPNNNFFIKWDKKIVIKGSDFDATNLPKFLSEKGEGNKFKEINKSIEIDLKKIQFPLSEKLQDFRLIGEIKNGKFTKISSKGDFGGNNFLDISLKKDNNSNKKYLEIYSDLTRPLLTEFSFFKGLTGGKLFFTSLIEGSNSSSKLKIENFKVVNAPGLIKLLSLADLGGLLDLAQGDGLSFDVLEIDMEKNKNLLVLSEILALGPSMSVLMEGYIDNDGVTSLKGTLVPAKALNRVISKIPVIGSIVIPKEAGEGLFGISFKMKGPKDKIKTTINPIRTVTPRFIQKIIDKKKETK